MFWDKLGNLSCLRATTFQCVKFYQTFQKKSGIACVRSVKPFRFSVAWIKVPVQSVRFLSSEPAKQTEKNKNAVVYVGPLKSKIKLVKILSLSSSAIGLTLQPIVIYNISQVNVILGVMATVISTMFLSTPLLLHWITKRYVIELHFDSESKVFTAKTLSLFNKVKEIKFTADDVTVPTLPGILSSFHVKNTPMFVDGRIVEDPDAYAHMMGLDKPFDILLNELTDEKKSD